MTEHECPYGSAYCPKVLALEDEVDKIEAGVKSEVSDLRAELRNMSKTLYIIAGILFVNLGVTLW